MNYLLPLTALPMFLSNILQESLGYLKTDRQQAQDGESSINSNTCFMSSFEAGFEKSLNCLFEQGQFAFIPHFALTEWTMSPTS